MSRVAMTILILEAIVLGLSVPVAIEVSDVAPLTAWLVGGGLAVLAIVASGMVRRGRAGYILGTVLQVAAIAMGLLVPTMFFIGAVFALLWFVLLKIGPEVDAAQAARKAQDPPSA